MGNTIIGSLTQAQPTQFAAPIVELAAGDDFGNWQYSPDITLAEMTCHAGSLRPDSCQIERRYGKVKFPYETSFTQRPGYDIANYWVRVSLSSDQGTIVSFVGLVENQSRILTGTALNPSGDQKWVVAGGLKILQRQYVSSSFFFNADSGVTSEVGWIPAMNERDKRGLLVGNKIANGPNPFYGGTSLWSHGDYLNYLLQNFIQQYDDDDNPTGPTWTIGGQADILNSITTTIKFRQNASIAEMLKELIPVKFGLDFFISPTDAGFEITVFALSATGFSFSGASMPANPNTVQLVKSQGDVQNLSLFRTHIVEAVDLRYDKIEVLGQRIVVCGSLRGKRAGGKSLVKKWSDAIEADYKNPAGAAAGTFDEVRKNEKYSEVYRHLGAPLDWDMDGKSWNVYCNADGSVHSGGALANIQSAMRETLHWIPLKEGFDYSTTPPTDNTLGDGEQSDTKFPIAFIMDESGENTAFTNPPYVACHKNGIHVKAPFQDWGIVLDATPNHLLALNSFSSDDNKTTSFEPYQYDYNTAVATIAMYSNHRLKLEYSIPPAQAAGDGSVMTIIDEESELWYLLEGTAVDVDAEGNLVEIQGGDQVLRNDVSRLALIMAGAVTRYINERARAEITLKNFFPWGQLLGNILTVVQQGDDITDISAPITSVSWINSQSPTTIVRTGYA